MRAAATLFVSAVRRGAAFGASGAIASVSIFGAVGGTLTPLGATVLLAGGLLTDGLLVEAGLSAFGLDAAFAGAGALITSATAFGFGAILAGASPLPAAFFAGGVVAFATALVRLAGAIVFAAAFGPVVPAFTCAPVVFLACALAVLAVAVLVDVVFAVVVFAIVVLAAAVLVGRLAACAAKADRADRVADDARAPFGVALAAGLLALGLVGLAAAFFTAAPFFADVAFFAAAGMTLFVVLPRALSLFAPLVCALLAETFLVTLVFA